MHPDRRRARPHALAVLIGLVLATAPVAAGEPDPSTSRVGSLMHRKPAVADVTKTVSVASGLGNVYLVTTKSGHVVIDTGVAQQSSAQRDLLLARRPGRVSHVIVSHAHGDHSGGVPLYLASGARLIAQRRFVENATYASRLAPIMARRNAAFWGAFAEAQAPPIPKPDVIVDDVLPMEIGGRRFELLHIPSESTDMLAVWLPDERIVFTGDLYGSSFPNLYTLRGHYYRFPWDYIESLERVMALEPEILAPAHFEPIIGRERVRESLTALRDAVRHVHDETVRGMNEGRDLWSLMRDVRLPEPAPGRPKLVDQSHGSVDWSVRAIWEGYLGWFRYESATEIYPVPPASVHPDLVELAGGPDALVARARSHLAAGRPVEALHLLDVCRSAAPDHRGALEMRLQALRALLAADGENFNRQAWLRHEIAGIEGRLAE